MKKKRSKGRLYRIVILLLLGIMLFCGYKIAKILYEYHEGSKVYSDVARDAKVKVGKKQVSVDWEKLRKKNDDVVAWLYSAGSVINYPVVQGQDNKYYLHRLINGEYNFKGTLFVDYRVEKPFKGFNTIIYGHRMKDGSMFKPLVRYDDMDYYKKHKVMRLATPEKNYDLLIFAMSRISVKSKLYKIFFNGDAEKREFIDEIRRVSAINPKVRVTKKDKIVMMSTCTAELDDKRIVVFGKLKARKP